MIERVTGLWDERGLEPELLRLVDMGERGWGLAAASVAVAAMIGAVHAVGPGHGKVLIGAYLAGSRGRPRDAVALGVVVAAMHTGSVLVLGILLTTTGWLPGGAALDRGVMLVSATAVTGVGVAMLVRAVRAARAPAVVARQPQPVPAGADAAPVPRPPGHATAHVHDHAHGHHRHALPEGVPPLSRAGIVALATSGGLLPSPAAFLVLATAIAVGRTGFGVALVGAFSAGLALTVIAFGVTIVWGRQRLGERAIARPALGRVARLVPLGGASVVVVGGLVLGVVAMLG